MGSPGGFMNKNELAELLAKEANLSPAEAADDLDRVVSKLLRNLRRGTPATLPGLGALQPGGKPAIPENKPGPAKSKGGAPRSRTR
jgi:nucleoid DNA-binding protein